MSQKFFFSSLTSQIYRIQNIIYQFDNKMTQIEKLLLVNNHKYPFGSNPTHPALRVLQKQEFSSMETYLEKKSQMLRKHQIISNPGIINLLSVSTKNKTLIYEWQFVPHSISSYVRSKFTYENNQIWEMAKKLVTKKITYQLTILMSYLAKMRIQTQLSMHTIGISHDEKIKLYLSPRTKMGIRSELFLISQYGQAKQKILKELQGELQLIRNDPDNPNFRGTRPYFESKMLNGALLESINLDQDIKTEPIQQNIGSTSHNKYQQAPLKRKMSLGNFDLNKKPQRKSSFNCDYLKNPITPKNHRLSFQMKRSKNINNQSFTQSFVQDQRESMINHSKTVKIELEQTQKIDPQRKRKDSYKVKITTCRSYEVDDPKLFNQNSEGVDIFQYFSKRAEKQEEQLSNPKSSNDFDQNKQKGGLNTTAPFTPPPSPLLSPMGISQVLQERLRQVRQRSQKVLTKIKLMKK